MARIKPEASGPISPLANEKMGWASKGVLFAGEVILLIALSQPQRLYKTNGVLFVSVD